jgi:hypothetical protein
MIENQKDVLRTKELRKAKVFIDGKSWISFAGHVYLKGKDASRAHDIVFDAESSCGICGKRMAPGRGDLEHIRGGRKLARCWCYHQVLTDGTTCVNIRRTHGMFDPEPCHRAKHGRELRWKTSQ